MTQAIPKASKLRHNHKFKMIQAGYTIIPKTSKLGREFRLKKGTGRAE